MQVFSKDWFQHHQGKLLWLANTWIGRRIFRIDGKRSSVGKNKITCIAPNAITWVASRNKGELATEFRTCDEFAMRLFHVFKPFWYLLHFIDWLLLDRFKVLNSLSFSFSTLTVYPDVAPGTTSTNGYVRNDQLIAVGWAAVVAAATGTASSDGAPTLRVAADRDGTGFRLDRSIVLFDTSALTAGATISSATVSFNGVAMTASATFNIRLVTSTPASNTSLSNADFDQLGTVAQASDYPSTSYVDEGYNDMPLNATGLSNISKTGVTKFGLRDVEHDIGGTAPGALTAYEMTFDSSNNDPEPKPKLVVTYTSTSIKTVNGLAIASVKTAEGLAIASVKSINGLA